MKLFKLKMVVFASLAFGLTMATPPAHATVEEAVKAYAQKKYDQAAKLFRPLAEKGNAVAQYRIALMHRMGLGLKKDRNEAKKWSRLAAKQGNPDAQQLLGSLYYKGEGAEPDDVAKAYMWYDVAAAQGNTEAQKERDTVAKELTPQQLAAAKDKAATCKASKFEKCD